MKKYLTFIIILVSTIAAIAGSAILAWDYDFNVNPEVTSFKLYAVQGSNTVFLPNNINATKTAQFNFIGLTGYVTNLQGVVNGLSPGYWTFVCTAIGNGAESTNSNSATKLIKPGSPQNLQ